MSTGDQSKEELKIKDLLIKLQVLTNALVEERKKSQAYVDRIKEYEESLRKKDDEIVELNKEKVELKSKLSFEKNKQAPASKPDSIIGSLLSKINAKPVDENKIRKYEEVINQQEFELKNLSQKLQEEKERYDQERMKYETNITVQKQEISELKKKIENFQTDNVELQKTKENVNLMIKNFELEKAVYEEKFARFQKENADLETRANDVQKRLDVFQKINDEKEKENKGLKKQINDLALQLNDMKNEMMSRQLSTKTFKVEKVKEHGMLTTNKKPMTITFQVDKTKNICEVVFKRNKQKGVVEDHVNIVDISQFEINEKNPNKIDISFVLDGEQISYSVIVHEMIIDLLFQTYREFLTKANENM